MDTNHINFDPHPDYLRIDIKGRITQLSHPENILVEKSKVQRSTTTGVLCITMPKANITEVEAQQLRIKRRLEQREKDKKLRALEKAQEEALERAEKEAAANALKKPTKADYDKETKQFLIKEEELENEKLKRQEEKKAKFYAEFKPDFDLSEVPDLE